MVTMHEYFRHDAPGWKFSTMLGNRTVFIKLNGATFMKHFTFREIILLRAFYFKFNEKKRTRNTDVLLSHWRREDHGKSSFSKTGARVQAKESDIIAFKSRR